MIFKFQKNNYGKGMQFFLSIVDRSLLVVKKKLNQLKLFIVTLHVHLHVEIPFGWFLLLKNKLRPLEQKL